MIGIDTDRRIPRRAPERVPRLVGAREMSIDRSPLRKRDWTESNLLWLSHHLLGPRRFERLLGHRRKANEARILEQLEARGTGRTRTVPRLPQLSVADFRSRFQAPCLPVILAGFAREWPCTGRWTPEYLAERHGEEMSSVTDYGEDRDLSIAELVSRMREAKVRASHFSKLVHNSPELIGHLDTAALRRYWGRPWTKQTSYQFFMGPRGAVTKAHAGCTSNLHIQIHGEKTWRMISPTFNPVVRPRNTRAPLLTCEFDPTEPDPAHPSDRLVDVHEAKLYPGDVLFVPTYYWHHVSYDTDSIASGIRWVEPLDLVRPSLAMFLVTLTASNPTFFSYYTAIYRGRLNRFFGTRAPGAAVN